MDFTDPTSAALLCAEALDRAGLAYAFYGGLVLAAYGEPRETHDVDVAIVDLKAETAAQARATEDSLRGRVVRVVAPEEYVVFKALATRDRDLEDAASDRRRIGDVLDLGLIESEVASITSEIPDWDARTRWTDIRRRARA